MPPPPPPSKSYNLVLDTDSEDESSSNDDYEQRREAYLRAYATASATSGPERVETSNGADVAPSDSCTPNVGGVDTVASGVPLTSVRATDQTVGSEKVDGRTTVRNRTSESKELVNDDDDDDDDDAASCSVQTDPTKRKKKKKKKRKKKKKKRKTKGSTNDDNNDEDEDDGAEEEGREPQTEKKRVVFGADLIVREYPRVMGGDGVPNDGGWPLSLSFSSSPSSSSSSSSSVPSCVREYKLNRETFEARKCIELRDRYTAFVLKRRHKLQKEWQRQHGNSHATGNSPSSSSSNNNNNNGGKRNRRRTRSRSGSMCSTGSVDSTARSHPISPTNTNHPKGSDATATANSEREPAVYVPPNYQWESRQMDHKKKNNDRHGTKPSSTGLPPPSTETTTIEERLRTEWDEIQAMGRNVVFGPLRENERKALILRDNDNNDDERNESSTGGYDATDIRHVRNELEQIRIQRNAKGATGCSCRKFVMPQIRSKKHNGRTRSTSFGRSASFGGSGGGGGGGGCGNVDRKLKEELRKRKIHYDDGLETEELLQMLTEAVENEGCCYGNDCECFRNGVDCQMDTCSCWRNNLESSSGGAAGFTNERYTVGEVQKLCGNKFGMYVVDWDTISENRNRFLRAKEENMCGSAVKSA